MNKTDLVRSELDGISLMTDKDINVYSVGISTFGTTELEMARQDKSREIIATTIDAEGIRATEEKFKQLNEPHITGRITLKNEDVSKPLQYPEAEFDFVYARLVLHYLDRQGMASALKELNRILKKEGKLYVVVRSIKAWDANLPENTYNNETCMTTYPFHDHTGKLTDKKISRQFFTPESIQSYLIHAGFVIKSIIEYEEQTFQDFLRQKPSLHPEPLIEVYAVKG